MSAYRRPVKPLDWRQIADAGEKLLSAHTLEAQREQIIAVTSRLIEGKIEVWLQEDLFRLPDWNAERLFPNQPPLEGMRRAIKSKRLLVGKYAETDSTPGVFVSLPLEDQGFMLGALQVTRLQGPKFRREELELLEGLARILSIGLFAAHRVEVERFRRGQLNLVREVSSQIANVLNVDELTKRVSGLIQKTFNYYYVAIFTLEPNSRLLRFRASAGTPRTGKRKASLALEVELGQGLIGEAAALGEQIVCDDVRLDPRFRYLDSLPETRSEVVIPLKIEGSVLGVLDVQSNKLQSFHPNDLLILNALADNVARAIEGARVYSDMRRRADQLSLVAEVSKNVTSTLDLKRLMSGAAQLIHERFGYEQVSLFTVHPIRRLIVYEAGSGKRNKKLQGYTLSLDQPGGIIPKVARLGKAILANDVTLDESYLPSPLAPLMTKAELTIPLSFNDRVLGVLDIQSDHPNAFSEDDQLMFEAVADTMAAAIRNADLYQSEIWRRQVADSLREVAGLLSDHVGVDQVLDAILVELERNLPVDVATIWLVRDGTLELNAAHGADLLEIENAYVISPGSFIHLENALLSANPVIRKPQEAVLPPGLIKGSGSGYSALMVPMRLEDQPLGLITLSHRTPGRYGHEAQAMTATFASYAAVAIENARLYDEAQEQAYASAAMLQVAKAAVSSNDLTEVLGSILRVLPILLGVKRAAIYLWDPNREVFSCGHHFGFFNPEEKSIIQREFKPGAFTLLDLARDQDHLISYPLKSRSSPRSWPAVKSVSPYNPELGTAARMLLAIPISIKNEPYGVLLLEESGKGRRYRTRRIEMVTSVAQQAALAIQNDRLHQEIVARERLETEASLARQIQLTFIPDSLPRHPKWEFAARWETAREVGGDFYDVIELPDHKIGLFIADVADKGMPAALFMALTRTLMRAAILESDSPAMAVRRVNDLLLPDTRQGMFVTAFLAVLDLENSDCIYVNAGHNPPLLIRAAGQLERLTRTAIALGLMDQLNIRQKSFHLEAGDKLLLYTDGVTEAMSDHGDFFGENRLQDVLRESHTETAEELLTTIQERLNGFTGPVPLADDLTMLAVGRL